LKIKIFIKNEDTLNDIIFKISEKINYPIKLLIIFLKLNEKIINFNIILKKFENLNFYELFKTFKSIKLIILKNSFMYSTLNMLYFQLNALNLNDLSNFYYINELKKIFLSNNIEFEQENFLNKYSEIKKFIESKNNIIEEIDQIEFEIEEKIDNEKENKKLFENDKENKKLFENDKENKTTLIRKNDKEKILINNEEIDEDEKEFIYISIEDEKSYPISILSNNEKYYEILFSILSNKNSNNMINNLVWNLIVFLPTNTKIKNEIEDILKFENKNEINWEKILNSNSTFKFLYSLQILNSIIFDKKKISNNFEKNFLLYNGKLISDIQVMKIS
jgi:hypothetical protein